MAENEAVSEVSDPIDPVDQMIQEELARMEQDEAGEAATPESDESEVEEESEAEETEAEETEEEGEDPESEETEGEESKGNKGRGAQARINQLVVERNEARKRAAEFEAALNAKQETQAENLSPLDLDDFESYDDYLKAESERLAKVKLQEMARQQQAEAENQKRLKLAQDFRKKIDESGITDYDEKIQALQHVPLLSNEVIEAIQEDPVGPKIAYYLAEHLDVAEEVATSSPFKAAKIIGQLSEKLQNLKQVPKKQTEAPDPIKPIIGKNPSKEDNLAKMPLEKFLKL